MAAVEELPSLTIDVVSSEGAWYSILLVFVITTEHYCDCRSVGASAKAIIIVTIVVTMAYVELHAVLKYKSYAGL